MKSKEKTKEQLVDELVKLRQQITELEHVKRRIFNRHIVYNNYVCLKNLTDDILIHPTILSALNKGDIKNLKNYFYI